MRARSQGPVTQNPRAQSAAALEKFFRTPRDRAIHPITWPAFLRAIKANALHFKILSNQAIKIDIPRENISPNRARRNPAQFQCVAELIENFEREKSHLSFVIRLEVEVAIVPQPATGDALDHRQFDHRKVVRLLPEMSDKIVTGRNVKVTDFHSAE